jgi:hypothetical protein
MSESIVLIGLKAKGDKLILPETISVNREAGTKTLERVVQEGNMSRYGAEEYKLELLAKDNTLYIKVWDTRETLRFYVSGSDGYAIHHEVVDEMPEVDVGLTVVEKSRAGVSALLSTLGIDDISDLYVVLSTNSGVEFILDELQKQESKYHETMRLF